MATIRKLPSGKWQAVIRLEGFQPRSATFSKKSEAVKYGKEEETKLKHGLEPSLTQKQKKALRGLTLGDLVEKWTAVKKLKSYAASTNSILRDPLAKMPLTLITREMVFEWKSRKLKQIKSSSVAKYARVPRGAWEYGTTVLRLRIGDNPFNKIDIKESKRRRHRRLVKGEYDTLIGGNRCSLLKDVIDFALETAMRRGEIVNIKPSHIREINGKQFLWIPENKTDTPAMIPLTKKAQAILHARTREGNGNVFEISANRITYLFGKLCSRTHIEDLHFHDLRHEALSRLNDKGLSVFDIKKVSRHKTTANLDIYIQPDLDRIAAQMGA